MNYYTFKQARRRQPIRVFTPELSESLDKTEEFLRQRDLLKIQVAKDEIREKDEIKESRISQIFRAFIAKDYLNPITRESIITALIKGRN